MSRAPYPLQWPDGWPRTPAERRDKPKFVESFAMDRDALDRQLRRFRGAVHVVITSNLPTTRSGVPYATGQRVADPGIAIWWVERGKEHVMACDRWRTCGYNLSALQRTFTAMRGIDRWGCSQMTEKAFAGFAALPPGAEGAHHGVPADIKPKRSWVEVLAMPDAWMELPEDAALAVAKSQYKKLCKLAHPDQGGSDEMMRDLNDAMESARNELGVGDTQ